MAVILRLVCKETKQNVQMELDLDRPCRMGRSNHSDIVLYHPSVASEHCEIIFTKKGLKIRNFHPKNKTLVANRQVIKSKLYLFQKLTIGPFQFSIVESELTESEKSWLQTLPPLPMAKKANSKQNIAA